MIFLDCSRYWMCNTDLTDCLCECPPMAPEGSLVFDYTIDYEHGGPVCNWPWAIECENKPNYCSKCEAWQEMTSFRWFKYLGPIKLLQNCHKEYYVSCFTVHRVRVCKYNT